MRKFYILYIVIALLYLILSAVDRLYRIDALFLSIVSILMWVAFFLIAMRQMLTTAKANRKFKHYFFAIISFLMLFLTVYRIITR